MSFREGRATITLAFPTDVEARAVHDALAPENGDWIATRVEGAVIRADARADRLMTLLRTVDDFLADASAASGSLEAVDDA